MSPTAVREIPADRAPDGALLAETLESLARGEVVGLPTETVYGLAVRADRPEPLARLAELKGRDAERALTWHVGDVEAGLAPFGELRALVRRVAERYWPGPLTLVLHGVAPGLEAVARDGWTGVRCPAHAGTRAVLEAAPFPVVASSANLSGEPPMTDAGAVRAAFDGALGLVLDGGPARLGESSTVLAVGRGRFEVLRGGLIEEHDLLRAAGLSVLFVCTGNTCRSPMAEALARAALAEHVGAPPERFGFELGSAGVAAGPGSPASQNAVEVLAQRGLDLDAHRSSAARPEALTAADRVYCLTASHRDALLAMLPPRGADHVALLDPEGRDVPDPIGGDLEQYRACAAAIERAVVARLDEWA